MPNKPRGQGGEGALAETIRSNKAGEGVDRIKARNSANQGPKFSSPKPIRNMQTGEVTYMQFSDAGGTQRADLPQGYEFVDDLKAVNTGTGTAFVDPTTGTTVKTVRKNISETKANEVLGKKWADLTASFPDTKSQANLAIDTIDQALTHPGLNISTGLSSVFPNVAGTEKADFQVFLEQMQGQTFLDAI